MVGTNGIGTALEAGGPMHVFGHEHYAENLEDLACAGVPIRHPISGKIVGALDLTCWRKDAGPLLVTLAKTTAEQIRQALLTETGMREIELMHEYLRACRRTAGMVFALNNDVVMMNEIARSTLRPDDQAALLQHAAEALAGRPESDTVELPSGTMVRTRTRPVRNEGRVAGGVVDAKVVERGTGTPEAGGSTARMLLPGLVGSGTLWRRACGEVEAVYRSGDGLVLSGEPGVGKLAMLRALHQRLHPAGRFSVVDGADAGDQRWLTQARRTLSDEEGTMVFRHLDRLDPVALRALSAALAETVRRPEAWIAVAAPPVNADTELGRLLRMFPSTVEVPPLRHHIEDVHQLVPFFLLRLGYGGQLTCSPEAMQLLMRSSWPGNIAQVLHTLRRVVQHRRTGSIQPNDLPPEIRTVSRRLLSPLESMERDAIVLSLRDAGGNKTKAALAVGMSRATIYRKIHEYGIVTPAG